MNKLADYFVIFGYDYERSRGRECVGKVIQRFPTYDWESYPFQFQIDQFCQPTGWALSREQRVPTFYVVHLSDANAQLYYCACLTFQEAVPQDCLANLDLSCLQSFSPNSIINATGDNGTTMCHTDSLMLTLHAYDNCRSSLKQGNQLYHSNPRRRSGGISGHANVYSKGDKTSAIVSNASKGIMDDNSENEVDDPNLIKPVEVYAPKCLVLIARHDHFTLLKNCLSIIYTVFADGLHKYSLEMIVAKILSDVDIPPKGGPRLTFSIGAGDKQVVQPALHASLPTTRNSVYLLFKHLGIQNVLLLFSAVLNDKRIVVCSRSITRLTEACHALTTLIYPLKFGNVYVPVLPTNLMEYLNAPTPFLFGIHVECKNFMPETHDFYIADLDGGSVTSPSFPSDGPTVSLLEPYLSITSDLLTKIFDPDLLTADDLFHSPETYPFHSNTSLTDQGPAWLDKCLRAVFIRLFAQLLCGYRSCLSITRIHPSPVIHFNQSHFLLMRGFNDTEEFMKRLLRCVAFDPFIKQRGPPFRVCDLFDEECDDIVNQMLLEQDQPSLQLQNVFRIAEKLWENENVGATIQHQLPHTASEAHLRIHPIPFPYLDDKLLEGYIDQHLKRKTSGSMVDVSVQSEEGSTAYEKPERRFVPPGPKLSQRVFHSELLLDKRHVIKEFVANIFNQHLTEALKRRHTIRQDLRSRHIRRIFVEELHRWLTRLSRMRNTTVSGTNSSSNTLRQPGRTSGRYRLSGGSALGVNGALPTVDEHVISNSLSPPVNYEAAGIDAAKVAFDEGVEDSQEGGTLDVNALMIGRGDRVCILTDDQFHLVVNLLSEALSKNGATDESGIGTLVMDLCHNICMTTHRSKLRYYAYMDQQIQRHAIWENQEFWEATFCDQVNKQIRQLYLHHSEQMQSQQNSPPPVVNANPSEVEDVRWPVYSNNMTALEIAAQEMRVAHRRNSSEQEQLCRQEENGIASLITHFISLIVQFRLPINIAAPLMPSSGLHAHQSKFSQTLIAGVTSGSGTVGMGGASGTLLGGMSGSHAMGHDHFDGSMSGTTNSSQYTKSGNVRSTARVNSHAPIPNYQVSGGAYFAYGRGHDSDAESGIDDPSPRLFTQRLETWLTKFVDKVASQNHLNERLIESAKAKIEAIIEGHWSDLEKIYPEIQVMPKAKKAHVRVPQLLSGEIGIRLCGRESIRCHLLLDERFEVLLGDTSATGMVAVMDTADDVYYGVGMRPLLPAYGALFLTNYRLIFNGYPVDQYQANKLISVSFPVASLLQIKKLGRHPLPPMAIAAQNGIGSEYVEVLCLRSTTMQMMKLGLEDLDEQIVAVSSSGVFGQQSQHTGTLPYQQVPGSVTTSHTSLHDAGQSGGDTKLLVGFSAAHVRDELRQRLLTLRYPPQMHVSFTSVHLLLPLDQLLPSDGYSDKQHSPTIVVEKSGGSSGFRSATVSISSANPSVPPSPITKQGNYSAPASPPHSRTSPGSQITSQMERLGFPSPNTASSGVNSEDVTPVKPMGKASPWMLRRDLGNSSTLPRTMSICHSGMPSDTKLFERLLQQGGVRDYERQGFPNLFEPFHSSGSSLVSNTVRVTYVNRNYDIAKTYPAILLVPKAMKDEQLLRVAKCYRNGRFPVIVWRHPRTSALLLRGSSLQSKSVLSNIFKSVAGTGNGQNTLSGVGKSNNGLSNANAASGFGFTTSHVTHDILNELEVSRPSVTASNVNNSLLPSSTVGGLQAQSLLPDQFLYLCMVADMSPGLSVPVTVTGGSVTTGVGVGVISNEPPLIPPEMMYGTGQIGHHHLNVAGSLSVSSGTAGGSGGAVKMSQSRGTNSVNMIQQAGGKVGQVLDKAWNNFSAAVSKSKTLALTPKTINVNAPQPRGLDPNSGRLTLGPRTLDYPEESASIALGSSLGDDVSITTSSAPELRYAPLYVLCDKSQIKPLAKLESQLPQVDFVSVEYVTKKSMKAAFDELYHVWLPCSSTNNNMSAMGGVDQRERGGNRQRIKQKLDSSLEELAMTGVKNSTNSTIGSALLSSGADSLQFRIRDCRWLQLIQNCLQLAGCIVDLMESQNASVALCLEEDSDAGTQAVCLAQIMMEPYYRTLDGFASLVDREWLQMGHDFLNRSRQTEAQRSGNGASTKKKFTPSFLMWLDAVHQLLRQYPQAFEFNDFYLRFLAYHHVSNRFYNFKEDCEKSRLQWISQYASLDTHPHCVWNFVRRQHDEWPIFFNFLYSPISTKHLILRPSTRISCLHLWDYFLPEELKTGPCNGASVYDIDQHSPSCRNQFSATQDEYDPLARMGHNHAHIEFTLGMLELKEGETARGWKELWHQAVMEIENNERVTQEPNLLDAVMSSMQEDGFRGLSTTIGVTVNTKITARYPEELQALENAQLCLQDWSLAQHRQERCFHEHRRHSLHRLTQRRGHILFHPPTGNRSGVVPKFINTFGNVTPNNSLEGFDESGSLVDHKVAVPQEYSSSTTKDSGNDTKVSSIRNDESRLWSVPHQFVRVSHSSGGSSTLGVSAVMSGLAVSGSKCRFCGHHMMSFGVSRGVVRCCHCDYICHEKCAPRVPHNCTAAPHTLVSGTGGGGVTTAASSNSGTATEPLVQRRTRDSTFLKKPTLEHINTHPFTVSPSIKPSDLAGTPSDTKIISLEVNRTSTQQSPISPPTTLSLFPNSRETSPGLASPSLSSATSCLSNPLLKQNKHRFRQTWKERYFTLDTLQYKISYKDNDSDVVIQRVIDLSDVNKVHAVHQSTIMYQHKKTVVWLFEIETNHRTFSLASQDPSVSNLWVDRLLSLI